MECDNETTRILTTRGNSADSFGVIVGYIKWGSDPSFFCRILRKFHLERT